MRRLEATEMWLNRRILSIPYTKPVSNEYVLKKIEKRTLIIRIKVQMMRKANLEILSLGGQDVNSE